MRVEWRRLAYMDAMDIADYIELDNPVAALTIFDEIQKQVAMLAYHPKIGRPGRVPGTRELVINRTPYIAVYFVEGSTVNILRVLHGAQRWPKAIS